MRAQKESPAQRGNAGGAKKAESLAKGTYSMDAITPTQLPPLSILDSLDVFNKHIQEAVFDGRIHSRPFVDYACSAAAIFGGFATIAEILLVDGVRQDFEGEEENLLKEVQKEYLIGLVRAVSAMMMDEACRTSDWAHHRLEEELGTGGAP